MKEESSPYQQTRWGPARPARSDRSGTERWRAPPLARWSTPGSFWPSTSSRIRASSLQLPFGSAGKHRIHSNSKKEEMLKSNPSLDILNIPKAPPKFH